MKTRVLSATDDAWDAALSQLPDADVYFRASYHRACEANGDGQALTFVAEEAGGMLFHPFLLRPLDEGLADIETAYGYTGPLCVGGSAFRASAWAAFADWCAARAVVAEFVRFNPLLDNAGCADPAGAVEVDRETVYLPLDVAASELWDAYPSRQRNMVRKAERRGLVAADEDIALGLGDFRRLYAQTMDRVGAGESYQFSGAYFDALVDGLGPDLRLFAVRDGGRTVAAGLFLVHGRRMHYHLSGSDPAYRDAGANNLLLHAAAEWGREHGARVLHLGGGRTPLPDDALLRFKSGLSRRRLPFYVGRVVRQRTAYDELCARWLRASGAHRRPDYFLLYRLPLG